jgi:hypothetical protein
MLSVFMLNVLSPEVPQSLFTCGFMFYLVMNYSPLSSSLDSVCKLMPSYTTSNSFSNSESIRVDIFEAAIVINGGSVNQLEVRR